MTRQPSLALDDRPVDRKVVLSGLWVATMFIFAYVDIFGFWRADVIQGALPVVGFEIGQRFLALTTVYVLIPSLMVAASLVLPARVNRVTQLVAAPLYLISIVAATVGETWLYFQIGSAAEVLLLGIVMWLAWSWPRVPASQPGRRGA